MTISHTTRSFHLEIQRLSKKDEITKKEAWEQIDKKYFELFGKHKYKNYRSFRNVNWKYLSGFFFRNAMAYKKSIT